MKRMTAVESEIS